MNNWQKIKLEDALSYIQPTPYIVQDTQYSDEYDTPVLTPGKSFLLGYTHESEGVYENVPTIIFDDFTTAFKYVDFPFKVKSSAMKMLEVKSDEFDIKFMYYLMQSLNFEADEHKRYWISKYSQQFVKVPSIDHQKKITAILDAADAYRQKTKALIAKYDELTQSLFLDMFGDSFMKEELFAPISEISSFIDYRGKTLEKVDSGIPYITAKSVRIGYFDKTRLDYITEETYNKIMTRGYPQIGDVLFTTEGATMGFTCRIPEGFENFTVGQRLITMQTNDKYNSVVLEFMLNSERIQDAIFKLATGSAVKGIRAAKFKTIKIPVPNIVLQNQFAERVQAIETQKAQAQESLAKAEDLFNSLLQKAFKGELV